VPRPSRQHPFGAHATSRELAGHITQLAFAQLRRTRGVRVLDPAVGHGVFLLAAAQQPVAALKLHGVDVDPDAVAAARAALPGANLRTADALDRATWAGVEPFDVVLLNPPWISWGNRQAHALSDERRAALREAFPLGMAGFPSAHGAFLELASDLVADDGVIGAIVPEQVAHLDGYRGVRRALLRRHRLRHIERVGESAFDGVTGPAVILVLGPPRADDSPPAVDGWLAAATASEGAVVGHATPTGHESLLARLTLLPKLVDLPGVSFADPGVHTGGVAAQLIARERPAGEASRSGVEGVDGAFWLPCRRGRDVRPFVVGEPSEWLRVAPPAAVPPGVTPPRIGQLERYQAVPLLLRQTADRPLAALHGTGRPTYFRNSVLACEAPDELVEALAVLLNSALLAWFHRVTWPDARQKTSPQVKVKHLRTLPCPPLAVDARDRLAAMARELAGRLSADADADVRDVEDEADRLLRELYRVPAGEFARVRESVARWPSVGRR